MWTPGIDSCDTYLGDRTGRYEYRAIRYRAALDWMVLQGLDNGMTIFDVGAGWTEFDYCLRKEYDFKGRYIPVDGGIDSVDINHWTPPRSAHFFVALELVEHLHDWKRLLERMKKHATVGVVLSTPNPATTDVLGMDSTHVCEVWPQALESQGFTVTEETFYGGVFSDGKPDSLLATWGRNALR